MGGQATGPGRQSLQLFRGCSAGLRLHRKLLALHVENILIRPQMLDEYRVRVKTDKTDALALVKRLDAYVRGNRKAFAVIRVPSEQEQEEQDRTVSHQREQLVREVRRPDAQGRSLISGGF